MDATLQDPSFIEGAQALLPEVVVLRRSLHRDPEVGNHLPMTRQKVLAALDGLPLELHLHEHTSGIVAVLGPDKKGPSIILRGDMDGLRMTEDTELEYASQGETMHACGHDLHTAMLAGSCRLLSARADELAGPVVFMFQPGEEGHHGARYMLEEGLLDVVQPRPVAGFALHVSSIYPSGTINHIPGPQMAAADEVHITIEGQGGHASSPYKTVDPIAVAAEVMLAIQTAITRRINVFDPAVVTIGSITAGTTNNVIPAEASMVGTIRTLSADVRTEVHELIARVTDGIAAAHGASARTEIIPGYPVTMNDPAVSEVVTAVAERVLGHESITPLDAPIMGAEDWSYVLEEVPGIMAFLGACPPKWDADTAPGNHSNIVEFDEEAMVSGMALYAAVAIEYAGKS